MEANNCWHTYFESIQQVCPWSLGAYKQDKITIQDWHSQILELGTQQAIVYTAPKHKPRLLQKIAQRLNKEYDEYEFLWSHPSLGENAAPTACLIQQHRETLDIIRKKL